MLPETGAGVLVLVVAGNHLVAAEAGVVAPEAAVAGEEAVVQLAAAALVAEPELAVVLRS